MCKKIISLLIFALALSLLAGAAEINSADDLLTLMNTPSMWADDYILTTDIDLGDATLDLAQSPIGTSADTPFSGTFDGQGNTISGIYLDLATGNAALFGYAKNATIENLTVKGTVIGAGNAVGGIVGRVDTSSVTITNCVNYCSISGVDSVGGIIGRVETNSSEVYIAECINYGTVSGARYAAGIAGFHSQTGGATTIENCINNGIISASSSYAAGISAYWRVYSGAKNKCFIQDCINSGNVTSAGSYAGGIIAYGSNRDTPYTITRCLNNGSITGSKYARPIAGTVSATTNTAGQFNNCYYTSTDTYTTDSYGVETFVADATVAANVAGLVENFVLVDGYAPELKAFHNHDYKYVASGAEHIRVCYCGDVSVTEAHSFVGGVCDKCGAEDVACSHENKYEVVETKATCATVGSKYEFCPDCNVKVSGDIEIALDSTNHVGALTMAYADGAITYTCECGAVVYTDSTLSDTVYVSENGLELAGNITEIGTAANPFKNFTDAMQYAAYAGKDVTVTILDVATTPANYVTPAFDVTVTVTGGKIKFDNRFVMSGKFVFEHIEIAPTTTVVMAAKEHKLVMGEGITCTGGSIYLVGGYEHSLNSNSDIPATGYASDITLRSGSYGAVGGGNRYLSGKYSGTIKLTLGTINSSDTLEITSTFTTASMNYDGGDGVNATVIIDGPVHINSFCPVTHAGTADGRFDIDIVVTAAATTIADKLIYRGSNYGINVYADNRVKGAEDFAAILVGADKVQPYKRYCLKINGEHPDANNNAICDNCGAPTTCEHENGELQKIKDANCVSGTTFAWYCLDCRELIEDAITNDGIIDSDNHISDSYVWQYENGMYFFGCSACGDVTEQSNAPTVYVSQSGSNSLDGMTPKKAVATVEEAVARLANVGGTVMICGEYILGGNLTLPAYDKEITFSGTDNAGEYGSFVISKGAVITLGGKTKFDKIGFGGSAVYTFECAWNNTTFAHVQPYGTATAKIVLGYNDVTVNDTEATVATLTITEGTTQRIASARYVDRFYSYIYLGDSIGASGVSVANKNATLNATDADIGVLYTMSTSNAHKDAPVENCETTVNLYGTTKVDKGRTGDYNVGYAESNAVLEKQTINFFDNSFIGSNYYIRNAKNTVINVSTEADGRNIQLRCPITFYAYGTFAKNETAMIVELNCDSHSFTSAVQNPCTFAIAADAIKDYSANVTDVCEYTSKVTVDATPEADGTKLYSCYCGRKYTEQFAYSCEDYTHYYVAVVDGGYVCTVCDESFAGIKGDNIFAVTVTDVKEETVTASVSVNGNFAAALVNITIPEGYTFANVSLLENDNFVVMGGENGGIYAVTMLSNDGNVHNVNITFEIVCNRTGLGVIEVSVPEIYGNDGDKLVATTVCAEIPEIVEDKLLGDVDGDEILTVFDALVIVRAIVNQTVVSNADMNGDGAVTLLDVIRIFKQLVG